MKPSKLLKNLSSLADEKREKKGSWVAPIIIFIISLFSIFVFAWVSGRNAKKLAKLKHEKNKRKVKEENLKLTMHRELNEKRILELSDDIKENKKSILGINNEIEKVAKAHQANLRKINSITGWKDI